MITRRHIQVLQVLISYGDSRFSIRENFLCAQTQITRQKMSAILDRLVLDEMVDYSLKSGYYVTLVGRALYDAICSQPTRPESYAAWCDEALTGIRRDGDPSAIVNAAIPGTAAPRQTSDVESRMIAALERDHD